MTYLTAAIVILVMFLLIIFAYLFRKSKIAAVLLLMFLWSLCVFSTEANDLLNMEYRYNNLNIFSQELAIGYNIIFNLFQRSGASFTIFKMFVGLFSLTIMYLAIHRSTNYVSFAIAIYAVYPFISNITQIRNGMSAAIVMYVLVCYIQDPNHNVRKYIFGILLACLFHYSAAFYLIFTLAGLNINKKRLFIIVIVMTIGLNILIYNNTMYVLLSSFITNERLLDWLNFKSALAWATEENHSWKTKFLLIAGHIFGYAFFYNVYDRYKKNLFRLKLNDFTESSLQKNYFFNAATLEFVHKIELLLFFLFPLYMLSPTYFRLYKNVIPIIYILTAQYVSLSVKYLHSKNLASLVSLLVIFYAFILMIMEAYSQGETLNMLNSYSLFKF